MAYVFVRTIEKGRHIWKTMGEIIISTRVDMTNKVMKNDFRETDAKSFCNMIEMLQKKVSAHRTS